MIAVVKSLFVFVTAALFEIGGGYLVWLWLKEGKPWWFGALGAIILALYGIVIAQQATSFGRAYAAYGGLFIALALIWAWKVDGFKPDKYDLIGAAIALVGAGIILYMPRGN